uniref:glutathione transferase n=1 Tax=Clastoptera arizonana TaxID=38151 RepID=A0A1B6C4P2_9HEMI
MAPKYKLIYFPVKGLGEPIRFLLAYLGEDFEDYRFESKDWPTIKPTTPFGKAPVLEVDGGKLKLCQSVAICRYLAKQAGLTGKDALEDLQIDIIVDVIGDLRQEIAAFNYNPDEKQKASKKETCLKETLPFYMQKLDAIAKENKGFLANGKLSWADIYLASIGDYLSYMCGKDIINPYPSLKSLREKVNNLPKIKEYIAKRPKTEK